MAFFQYLVDWYQNVRGGKLNPAGARGVGASYPEPTCFVEGPGNYEAGPVAVDDFGNLMTRGPVLVDEKSWRYGFPGTSLNTALTGTLTFQAGSDEVSGVGTAFLSELNNDQYIKLNSDGETAWRLVKDVISDTELELDEVYPTNGSGASSKTQVPTVTGTGGSFSVASSIVTIASGTTSGSKTYLRRDVDYPPMQARFQISVSNRRANQELVVGFVDDFANPSAQACLVFDGTDATICKLRTRNSTGASEVQEITVSLPSGFTSASVLDFVVAVTPSNVLLSCMGQRIAVAEFKIPGPYKTMSFVCGWNNTGAPAGSSNVLMDGVFVSNTNRLEVCLTYDGASLPVRQNEEVHRHMGTLTTNSTTANQIVCSYTVPTGKSLFVLSWDANCGASSVDGNPVRLGKNIVAGTTDPASPGATDGDILRSIYVNAQLNYSEDFPSPIYLAAAGETVSIAVTPSGGTSTVWRGHFEFILR